MPQTLRPFLLFPAMIAGWLERHQQLVIDYLVEENRTLKHQLGKKRLRLTDEQRRRLAEKGKRLGRKVLGQVATIVTPDTILRWHRQLIARKWTYSRKRCGRPGVMKEIEDLAVRMAKDNPNWGYRRIQGGLKALGHTVAHNTVKNILKRNGVEPAPSRKTTWAQFLKTHWETLGAADFFTVEVWSWRGLMTVYVFFVIKLSSRRVRVFGSTPSPNKTFMRQMAVEITEFDRSSLDNVTYLILDRDGKYSKDFIRRLSDEGVEAVKIPASSPNCNAYAERFVRSIKHECLDRMIFVGEASLRRAYQEYEAYFNRERPHQGIGNELVERPTFAQPTVGALTTRSRLGGLLNFYYRAVG